MSEIKQQLSVRLTEDLAREVIARSNSAGKSVSDVMRELIQSALRTNGLAAPPIDAANQNGEPSLVSAALAAELRQLFESTSAAWTALGEQMQEMASAIGQCRTETKSVKGEVELLRRDLRTLVGTLDDFLHLDGRKSTKTNSEKEGHA